MLNEAAFVTQKFYYVYLFEGDISISDFFLKPDTKVVVHSFGRVNSELLKNIWQAEER